MGQKNNNHLTSLYCINQNEVMSDQINNPLHGVTLKKILLELVDHYGWERMYEMVRINCFNSKPTINSSLKFLRKTPWARTKVEEIYFRLLKIKKA